MIAARPETLPVNLPLADQIREARRLSDEARDAHIHISLANMALAACDMLMRSAPDSSVLPGDDVVERLAERWESLADLVTAGPRPTQSSREQLRLRRQQMQSAIQLLAPIAHDATARDAALDELQHEQRHLLEDPRYAEVVAELTAIGVERDQVFRELQPLIQRAGAIGPSAGVLATFVERIGWAMRDELAVPGGTSWRAALVARDLLMAYHSVLAQYGLELPLPEGPDVPDLPDPERDVALTAQVQVIHDALVELLGSIQAENTRLAAEVVIVQQRYDELNQHILDRTG